MLLSEAPQEWFLEGLWRISSGAVKSLDLGVFDDHTNSPDKAVAGKK